MWFYRCRRILYLEMTCETEARKNMEKVRILIADDNPGVRRDLRTVLQLDERVEVVGEAANGAEAIRQARRLRPDAVLMDLQMPIMDGLEATWEIKNCHFARAVLILTVHGYDSAARRSLQTGADAFLVKGTPMTTVIDTLLSILEVK